MRRGNGVRAGQGKPAFAMAAAAMGAVVEAAPVKAEVAGVPALSFKRSLVSSLRQPHFAKYLQAEAMWYRNRRLLL